MNTKLKTEVDNVTYDGVSNADVAAALNLVNVDVVGVLTRKAALKWCTANQLLSVFEDNVDHVDVGIRNIVRAILRVLDSDGYEFDLGDAAIVAMFDALVTATILTADHKAQVLGLATTQTSIARRDGLGHVKAGHVQNVREDA
jgi:predicted nucleic acid-binding protein